MITKENIRCCNQPALFKGQDILMLPPDPMLRSYIACYTVTCPEGMEKEQAVLPSASSTLVYSAGGNNIVSGLRGVNTKPVEIGSYAQTVPLMLLIEFHPGGLFPFLKMDQKLIVDQNFLFSDLNPSFDGEIADLFYCVDDIHTLVQGLNRIFLSQFDETKVNLVLTASMKKVIDCSGKILSRDLAKEFHYSEKQLNRLFQIHVGTGIKTFSRIVRMKRGIELLSNPSASLWKISEVTGHYDPSHFIRDFKSIYGMTPKDCTEKMSLFYNDPFKL